MTMDLDIPWHGESWRRFIHGDLPALIEKHLPLSAYEIEVVDTYTFSLKLAFNFPCEGEVEVSYADLPQPDDEGIFRIQGNYRVVVAYPCSAPLAGLGANSKTVTFGDRPWWLSTSNSPAAWRRRSACLAALRPTPNRSSELCGRGDPSLPSTPHLNQATKAT